MTLLKIPIVYSLRMDTLIMEAINDLKEPGGSNKTAIGNYIEVLLVHTYIFYFPENTILVFGYSDTCTRMTWYDSCMYYVDSLDLQKALPLKIQGKKGGKT